MPRVWLLGMRVRLGPRPTRPRGAPGLDIRGRFLLPALLALAAGSCDSCGTEPSGPSGPTRSYRLGFSPLPPRSDQIQVFQSLELWTPRADAGIMHVQLPWAAMLAGSTAAAEVTKDPLNVANYYRGKGLEVVVTLDPTDGLNRSAEAPELVAAHRSLSEPAIQQLYRSYAAAIVDLIHPAYLGLAAETNLIRAVAPAPTTKLFVSVQVETAWGLLPRRRGMSASIRTCTTSPSSRRSDSPPIRTPRGPIRTSSRPATTAGFPAPAGFR
jgi:hypothetical protein